MACLRATASEINCFLLRSNKKSAVPFVPPDAAFDLWTVRAARQERVFMKILFKQRFFSWLDSYDIYDEEGRTAYTVEGKLSWGHRLEIYGPAGDHLGTVKEEVLTLLPRFALYAGEEYLGCIRKEFALFHPRFTLDCNGWEVEGSFLEWDYAVTDPAGRTVMAASKELLHWTDTYVLDIARPEDALLCLMIVLAIDAAKCSAGNG